MFHFHIYINIRNTMQPPVIYRFVISAKDDKADSEKFPNEMSENLTHELMTPVEMNAPVKPTILHNLFHHS